MNTINCNCYHGNNISNTLKSFKSLMSTSFQVTKNTTYNGCIKTSALESRHVTNQANRSNKSRRAVSKVNENTRQSITCQPIPEMLHQFVRAINVLVHHFFCSQNLSVIMS